MLILRPYPLGVQWRLKPANESAAAQRFTAQVSSEDEQDATKILTKES